MIARNVNPGAEVQGQYSGGTAVELFTVGELDSVWVFADVFEMDLARVQRGAPVSIKVVAYPDKAFAGKVDWISDALDPTSRTARVRCSIPNPSRELKPEMYATVAISVAAPAVAALPRASLLRIGDQTVVFVADRQRARRPRQVQPPDRRRQRGRGDRLPADRARREPRRPGRHLGRDPALRNALGAP